MPQMCTEPRQGFLQHLASPQALGSCHKGGISLPFRLWGDPRATSRPRGRFPFQAYLREPSSALSHIWFPQLFCKRCQGAACGAGAWPFQGAEAKVSWKLLQSSPRLAQQPLRLPACLPAPRSAFECPGGSGPHSGFASILQRA